MATDGQPRPLLDRRGHVRLQLQRELAIGDKTHAELAKKHGVVRQAITEFAKRHKDAIEAIRADIDNEFAGLWIAEKKNRVAAYQQDIDLVDAETERVLAARDAHREMLSRESGAEVGEDGEVTAEIGVATDLGRLSRIKHRALRAVAEELGQLPTRALLRIEDDGAGHSYVGVDIDKV